MGFVMRIRQLFSAAALGLAALSLNACATGLNTKVTRYQPASIPAGYSFYVVPKHGQADPRFQRYASMVSQQLQAQGFRPAPSTQAADMLVRIAYDVDEGETVVRSDPFYGPGYGWGYGRYGGFGYRDPFYDPYWGVWGRPYYSRWSRYPYYYGWGDPFSYGGLGGYGGRIESYTLYNSQLDMDIVQRATNAPLFEGHAQARSQTDELDALVPNLITAMFTGFPGRNGETVKITIPSTPRR
jgi:hypothetical protein